MDAPGRPPGDHPRTDALTAATEIVRVLTDAGYEAYLAGGCVRDRLLGIDPADYDVATSARPEDVGRLFRKAQSVGESFGVMLVRLHGHTIEVSTFRTEGVYSDGRHPDRVEFSDAVHDATRRDFTVNGLFLDPLSGRVIDHVNGQADLTRGLIRAIGDADARLREDRLRMLRAVRFAARFAFTIEPATAQAIRRGAGELQGVSRERVGQELRRMFGHPSRAAAARLMQELKLDGIVLQEAHEDAPLPRLAGLPRAAAFPSALAAWMLDRHEKPMDDLARRIHGWTTALVLSNAEQAALRQCLHAHYAIVSGTWAAAGVAGQKRLATNPGFAQALLLIGAVNPATASAVQQRVDVLAQSQLAPEPLIDGDDLIRMGVTPGPAFKEILDRVYDAQLEGRTVDRPQSLDEARRLASDLGVIGTRREGPAASPED